MKKNKIIMAHGAGGKLTHDLIKEKFLPFFGNNILGSLDDSAVMSSNGSRIAFTTDSFVVKPLFFPGGDIGKLSLCGTVNDLAMSGAVPLGISLSFIIEEGFPMEDLERILSSLKTAAEEAGVDVVTGDTKVVENGAAQGMFINTSGVGIVPEGVNITGSGAKEGDYIIINGPVGDHEIGVLIARGEFSLEGRVESDCAPLNRLVQGILAEYKDVHVLRDPTRGGVATTLWEIANASGKGILIEEEKIGIRPEVKGVCDLLGFDPWYLANEGKLMAFVPEEGVKTVMKAMRRDPLGRESAIIGRVVSGNPGKVLIKTCIGGHRLLEPMSGQQFPRIC